MKTRLNQTLKGSVMLLFDIGANRGDATIVGIALGYEVIALEPAPRIYSELVGNFIYNPKVIPVKFAVSDKDYERIEFYEADEDGLSTLNKDWLTSESMPYAGKSFRTIRATTITVDTLVKIYGKPDLMKIDVEGAEWSVFKGMTDYYGTLTFEWSEATLGEHNKQLKYLADLGYTEISPRFIEDHLYEPTDWLPINLDLITWRNDSAEEWETEGWKKAQLRPTADVGMCWVR